MSDGNTGQEQIAEGYERHIRLAHSIRQTIRKLATLAYEMGLIKEPTLNEPISLFIGWRLHLLKPNI